MEEEERETGACLSTQLIDGNGVFNVSGLESFMREAKFGECELDYCVVSIMGPQSSGKSTILNHLFGTNFREMDARIGRSQTTKGIWLAKAQNVEPFTLVLDLEGTDGSERGVDDTSFEKRSALFALVASDIVLINIWLHDIGREQAANRPLLRTIIQAMTKISHDHKTTLLFVIRDKNKTPLEHLEQKLRKDIEQIWDSVPKSPELEETLLSQIFKIEVVALSSYEEKEKLFKKEVADLRNMFQQSIVSGGLAGNRCDVIPASRFRFRAQRFWEIIKCNKALDFPSYRVMAATVRCEEIVNDIVTSFLADQEWLRIEQAVRHEHVPGFGKTMSSLLERYLLKYDKEATEFDQGSVRSSKRELLESKLLKLANPAYKSLLGLSVSETLEAFKLSLDEELVKEGYDVVAGGNPKTYQARFQEVARNCSETWLKKFDEGSEDATILGVKWDCTELKDMLMQGMASHATRVLLNKVVQHCNKLEEEKKRRVQGNGRKQQEKDGTDEGNDYADEENDYADEGNDYADEANDWNNFRQFLARSIDIMKYIMSFLGFNYP